MAPKGQVFSHLPHPMQAAVQDYIAGTGDKKIRAVGLKEQDGVKNGFGANYHPSDISQRELAEIVLEELNK